MCNLLGNDNVAIFWGVGGWGGEFTLCHADPTLAGRRNAALGRFSLTFGHEEGIKTIPSLQVASNMRRVGIIQLPRPSSNVWFR